jgi:transcriptional regulator with GAF, ATPase, and Fis domain
MASNAGRGLRHGGVPYALPDGFEEVLGRLSASLAAAPTDLIGREIEGALMRLRGFFGAHHCAVLGLHGDDGTVRQEHAVGECGPARETDGRNLAVHLPWTCARLFHRGEAVCFNRPDDLPPEAAIDRETLASAKTFSWLAVPVMAGGRLTHAVVLAGSGGCAWDTNPCSRLRIAGEAIAGALARARLEGEIGELRRQIELETIFLREGGGVHFEHEEIIGRSQN